VVKKSKDLLEINHKFPRCPKQDYNLFFISQHPRDSPSFQKYFTRNSILTTHNPSRKLSVEEILEFYEKIYSKAEILISKAKKNLKQKRFGNPNLLALEETEENKALFLNLRESAQELIGNMFFNISNALDLLQISRKSLSTHIEDDLDAMGALILFFILWFFCFKLTRDNFCGLCKVISDFTPRNIRNLLVNELKNVDKVTKSCILDLVIQLSLRPEEFLYPKIISRFIFESHSESDPADFYVEESMEILSSRLITDYFFSIGQKNYLKALNEIKNSIFLADLPDNILGLTLFNGHILLSESRFGLIENELLKNGFIFLCLLHEIAHYMIRYQYSTDKQWIENLTPRSLNEEAGNYLESRFFGTDFKFINIPACEFILNAKNWKMNEVKFRKKFETINKETDDNGAQLRENYQVIRFKMRSPTSVLFFRYCPKENRNRNPFNN
jgi:hypothetical protein